MNPVETVIEAYGGNVSEVARVCGVDRSVVKRWTDNVPAKHQAPLLDDAKSRGLNLTAEDIVRGKPA